MLKFLSVFILVSSSFFYLNGQSEIIGTVIGDEDEKLMSATVVLLSQADSTLVSFGLTNDKGAFKIEDVEEGAFLVQVTFLGYQQYSKEVKIQDTKETLDLGLINLSQSSSQLEQVEIKGEHVPIVVKKDTLEYNAAAFQTQPHEVVEDLLKKLPGVEVEDDGTVIAQGEEVQSVLVDGKKFFGDDPKIATKNLPADAVEKVQIFDKKSDMAEFSGVDDGEREKTINLELKEDRKKGQFGTVEAGYGTEERYKGRFSLNRFTGKLQLAAIGNFNNINEQGFSSGDYINFVQGMGDWGGARSNGINMSNGLSNGFVTTNAGGINLNYDISSKIDLSVSYFLNSINNNLESLVQREEFIRDGSFFDVTEMDQAISSDNHRANLEFDFEIDSTQDIKIRSTVSTNDGSLFNLSDNERVGFEGEVKNTSQQDLMSEGKEFNLSGTATYRKKFGKVRKRILTLSAGLNDSTNDSDGDLNSDNFFFNEDQSLDYAQAILQDQLQNNNQLDYNINASFVQPLNNGTFLEAKYRRRNFDNDVLYDVYDALNGVREFNTDLSNAYDRNYYFDRYALAWHLNSDNSSLTLEGALQNSVLNGDLISEGVTVTNKVFRFLPRVSWRYEFANSKNIRLRYSTSVQEPSLTQLQPRIDNSDPLNIYVGNPDLLPAYRHSLRLNFMSFDQFSFRSFFAFINMRYTKNNIENQTILSDDFVKTIQPVNVNNDLSLSSNVNFSTPLKFLKTRFNIGSRATYANGITFLNGNETSRSRIFGTINAKLENRKKDIFDWVIGGSWGYNVTSFALEGSQKQEYFNQSAFVDLTYNFKKSFAISTSLDVNFFSEEQIGEAQTVPILKASISKFVLKDQKGQIKLSAFDLLDQNLGVSRRNGTNFIENSEITSLGRFYMLSFIYSIRSVGGESQPGRRGGGRSGRR